jgi:hypothetical protein
LKKVLVLHVKVSIDNTAPLDYTRFIGAFLSLDRGNITMKITKYIVVASFFVAATAQANCGNNKNVGNGCSIEATAPTNQSVGVTTTIGSTQNDNRNTSFNAAVGVGGSSSSNASNSNSNMALGGQASNTNSVSAVGGAGGSAANTNSNTAAGGAGGASTSAVSGNTVQSNSEINVQNNTTSIVPRAPVASAIAPNTIFSGGLDSCMGTSSGSVQGLSFGVAVGTTWTDNHCVALRAAVRLNELGFKGTAAARLCAIPEIAEAFRKSKEFDCGE